MSEAYAAGGLSTISEVEALADQLSANADALHKRLMKEIKAHVGAFNDADQAVVRGLNDDEQLLRQRANSLYADAAAAVVPGLAVPQKHIMALTADAAEKIRKIGKLGEVVGLVGGLLSLAGSAMAGNLGGVVSAIELVRTHAAGVATYQPKPPPKP